MEKRRRTVTFFGENPFFDWLANKYERQLLQGERTIGDIPYCLIKRPQYGYTLIVFSLRAARGTSERCLKDTILHLELLSEMLKEDGIDAGYAKKLKDLARDYEVMNQIHWE